MTQTALLPDDGRPIHVLVVDDIGANLRLLDAVLTPRGFVVDTADSGPAALERLQELDVDVRGPRELPSSLRELERYDFVILSDAPAEAVSLTQQDAIEGYVRDLGGGFLFAGGESGYGLGGWYHTTIERILPVAVS